MTDKTPLSEALFKDALLQDLVSERRRERRWCWIKRYLLALLGIGMLATYLAMGSSQWGYGWPHRTEVIAVVTVVGEIGAGQLASAATVIPVLEHAFKSPAVKAIALHIDSPGGQPFEAERIGLTLDRLKSTTGKPVYAFIGNTGASAAYLLALHADQIIAGQYSLVGSIGAVISRWDVHTLLERWGIKHDVYVSGRHKHLLNPFTEPSKASTAKAQAMVQQMARQFSTYLYGRRMSKLKADVDFTTGELWSGEEALAVGLVDELGTLESVVARVWALPLHDFGPSPMTRSLLQRLSAEWRQALTALVQAMAVGMWLS
jgi:protease IV